MKLKFVLHKTPIYDYFNHLLGYRVKYNDGTIEDEYASDTS